MLTEHLSLVDNTGNIKEGENGTIAFLGTKLTMKEDRKVKVETYKKKTHTNQ